MSSTDDSMPFRIPAQIVPDDPMFIPMYKSAGAAAADLVANIPADGNGRREVRLLPGRLETIDCGFSMALEPGWEAQIRARSGLAQHGVQITNSPGTIDDDYRGRIQVILNNAGREIVVIKHGERIAQMALKPVYYFQWKVVKELDKTDRGEKGFGSTG
jgi:dUTP pyrophosphatase